jgi:diguanylate cyclase (GGDEF)-like protein
MESRAAAQPAAIGHVLPQLQVVADCLECGVLVLGPGGQVDLCSQPMASILGLSTEDVVGMSAGALLDRVESLVKDQPAVVRERGLLPGASGVVCEEFEIHNPARTVVRWVARHVSLGEPAVVVVCTDITVEVDLTSAYEKSSLTDPLTGLANRRSAQQSLQQELARARRHRTSLCVVMLDVDKFKSVNDRFGHGVGDQVLRQVAAALRSSVRADDVPARWGGEEFLVILANTDIGGARICAERIRARVECERFGVAGQVTVSAGVAQFEPGESLDALLARADARLYEAKAGGRNRVV